MSDVEDNFVKIALEKGWIKQAEEKPETKSRYTKSMLDAIELLYGYKPEEDKEFTMLERAHPEPVIIMPAYDAVNGLVENLYERQDIMHHIVTKPTRGFHNGERYVHAFNDLSNELIKAAFLLDKKNDYELMKTADFCAEQLTKAAWSWRDLMSPAAFIATPAAAGLIGLLTVSGPVGWAVAGSVAAIEAYAHWGRHYSQNIMDSINETISELEDILNDNDQTESLKSQVKLMSNDLQAFKQIITSINYSVSDMNQSTNPEKSAETAQENLTKIINSVDLMSDRIKNCVGLLKSVEDLDGATGIFSTIKRQFWSSDVEDAILDLENLESLLKESKVNITAKYKASHDFVVQNKDSLQAQLQLEHPAKHPDADVRLKPPEPTKTAPESKFDTSHDEELNRLMNQVVI